MDERTAILFCLRNIEDKLDWKPSELWTDYDFKLLIKEIHACSGISISTHTLKRLFGKIKYKSNYTPQHATKDALAQYIGYKSWEDYLRKSRDNIYRFADENSGPVYQEKIGYGRRTRRIYLGSFLTAGVFALVAAVIILVRSQTPEASFEVHQPKGTIPHTVTFVFDLSRVRTNQIYIDFDFVHPLVGSDYILRDRQQNLLNHTYQIPGVFHPRLVINNQPVDSGLVMAESNGWVIFYHRANSVNSFWVDNMIQNPSYQGTQTISRKDIIRYGIDTTQTYYISHRNIRNFGLSGDDFNLEVKFKNGPENGGISCYDSRIKVMGEYSESLVRMMEDNCHQWCELKFGENHYFGETSDISFLARDLSEWNILIMEAKDKHASIFFNDEKIYEESYTISSGDIKGLELFFKGSGMVDYILLTTPENDTVYFDDFME